MASTVTLENALAAISTLLAGATSATISGSRPSIRKVFFAQGVPTNAPKPFLAAQVLSCTHVGYVDGALEWKLSVKIKLVFQVTAVETAMLDGLAYQKAIDDLIMAWGPQTGIEGGEKLLWSHTIPDYPSHGQQMFAEADWTMHIYTAKGVE